MSGSLKLGRVAGIDVFVHWTFALLLGWILVSHLLAGHSLAIAFAGIGFILTVFVCIVLHEFGHALMAERFGVRTHDITLLPIGGVARLERMPKRPLHEFLIAIAGPAVNVVIALALVPVVLLLHGFEVFDDRMSLVGGQFLAKVLLVNVGLTLFNMLPAFPMDGGRVLRAALTTVLGFARATNVAAKVGQFVAIGLGILGLLGNPMLVLIALFIFIAGQQEAMAAHVDSLLRGVPVRDAMLTRFDTLAEDDRLDTAVAGLLASGQQDFPVVDGSRLVGVLRRDRLLEALREHHEFVRVADVMTRDCGVVEDTMLLDHLFREMQRHDCSAVPVVHHGELVGVVSLENIGEWLMVQSALRSRPERNVFRSLFTSKTG